MFTIGAYDAARAAAVTTLTELAIVDDDHIKGSGNDLYIPELNRLIAVYMQHGYNIVGKFTGGRVTSPSLRRMWPLDIARGLNVRTSVTDGRIEMFPEDPLTLDVGEAISALMINGAEANARGIVGLFFADGALHPIHGEIRTLRCTSVVTGTADVWTSGALTPAQDLPVGRYQLVGARVCNADINGLFRFILVGYSWRPGGVLAETVAEADMGWFRRGKLGVWGEFKESQLPRVEVLPSIVCANPDVYLDLIKVA